MLQIVTGIGASLNRIIRTPNVQIIQMMSRTGKIHSMDAVEARLAERGIECIRERFRVPALPQVSTSAGFLCGAAGAFLLAGGHPAKAFLTGLAGALLLLLDACGFSPLNWLGPKEKRSVLVIPGTLSEENRKALFLAVPTFCRLTRAGYFSREAASRRCARTFGHILSFSLPVLAATATLHFLPRLPAAEVLAGAVLAALSAGEWVRREPAHEVRNLAADWVERWLPAGPGFRPFVLVYAGDEADVKFFLAKYRHPVFRGHGVFLEFAETASGPPAASRREGGFLLPYRVDPLLLARVRAAAGEIGIPSLRTQDIRFRSGGLAAMARGFKAVTLFRMEAPPAEETAFPVDTAVSWVSEVVRRSGAEADLTVHDKGV